MIAVRIPDRRNPSARFVSTQNAKMKYDLLMKRVKATSERLVLQSRRETVFTFDTLPRSRRSRERWASESGAERAGERKGEHAAKLEAMRTDDKRPQRSEEFPNTSSSSSTQRRQRFRAFSVNENLKFILTKPCIICFYLSSGGESAHARRRRRRCARN